MRNTVKNISGSIVVGGTTSNAIQFNDMSPMAITTGSNVTATSLTFLVSLDGTTFYSAYDETSTEISITTTTTARAYRLHPSLLVWPWLKVREGTSASAVAQKTVDTMFNFVSPIL